MGKKKLKIAFLNIYNGVVNRGAETFIKEVASRLSVGCEVWVFQSGNSSGEEKYQVCQLPVDWDWSKKSGVGTFPARLFLDYWNRQILFFGLRCFPLIFRRRFDIVIPVNGGWLPAIMRICTWLYRGKMVVSGQSGTGWDDINNLWCFPNIFVAISSYARNWAKKINPLVRSDYIPNGVDLKAFKPVGERLKLNLKPPVVLGVGAFTKEKRLDCVIRAVAKIKDCSLLLVGGGGDKYQELKALGRKLLGKRFMITSLPFGEMPKAYRSADVFTLTSSPSHSFEIVLVEAMAIGLGVVANDDPIRKEIVGEAGFLVNPEDTNEYANLLKKALETKWGEVPQKQAAKFSWDEITKKYEQLFLDLCE